MINLWIVVFAGVVGVQLVGCFTDRAKLMNYTKPLLLPLLYLVVWSSGGSLGLWPLLALVFGYLGDLFLMKPDNRPALLAGILTFGLGHLFYTVALLTSVPLPPWQKWILPVALCLAVGVVLYQPLSPHIPPGMKGPVFFYIGVILSMALGAMVRLSAGRTSVALLSMIGAVFFVTSDFILGFELFRGKRPYQYFIVMVFYIAAQILLTLSFAQW